MDRIIIESPYAGDIEANVDYARKCIRKELLAGNAPIASHLLYTQPGILNDLVPEERKQGMNAGWAWLKWCNVVAFYIDRGISNGMNAGLEAVVRIRAQSITNYPKIEVRSLHSDKAVSLQLTAPPYAQEELLVASKKMLYIIAADERNASSGR